MDRPERPRYANWTRLIHGQPHSPLWDYSHHVLPPLTTSTTFRMESVSRGQRGFLDFATDAAASEDRPPTYIYDRLDEPNVALLEEHLREAEGGESAVAFACGMGAISAALMVCSRAGSSIVAHRTLYGCTFSLLTTQLPRYGIQTRLVDARDLDQVIGAIDDTTRVLYLETPANPTLHLVDIQALRKALEPINARRGPEDQVLIVVDNTFQTFWGQRPLELGADLVVASLTKNVGGFGVDMGGIVVGPRRLHGPLRGHRKDFGGVLSPSAAWDILVYGLSTLPLRLARQVETAGRVAAFLEGHPKVARVSWPGLPSFPQADLARRQMRTPEGAFCPGAMIYFEMAGDPRQAFEARERMVNHVAAESYCVTLAVSLGMTKTLIEAPGLMTHCALDPATQEAAGIHPGGVRISIGLEAADDLIRDLENALEKA
ncbi:MAG TPA: PLP-dependent transferase [Myxococcota bacterium]|nr:PLP-dependent transferase [Myxococcota bacterium]HQK51799.1 PLP-dependent transferase [Myxococcota bacterium]